MSNVYTDFLDEERGKIWQQDLKVLASTGTLGGGTAIAFQLRHRASYDFDIFYLAEIPKKLLLHTTNHFGADNVRILVDSSDELSVLVRNQTKVTFLYFPFPPLHEVLATKFLPLFSLGELASNKAYAIGRRPVYRDYVDLFFILQSNISLVQVINEAKTRFQGNFDEKLFLEQLSYFEDVDDFSINFIKEAHTPEQIKQFFSSCVETYLKRRV